MKVRTLVAATAGAFLAAGCVTTPTITSGAAEAKTAATGAAAGASAQGTNTELERCDRPFGTVALVEDQNATWYHVLSGQYKLTSTVPVLRLLIQQSNCFVVVDRGRAMSNIERERQLQQAGELRAGSNFGKGQLVSADYTITPEVIFSQKGTGGLAGGFGTGALAIATAILGSLQTNEAATILTLVDNRSGVQVAAAEGSARNMDFALGGLLAGASTGAGLGGYTNTPEGKVIAAAFMDSFNQLVRALRTYTQQTMGDRQLGTGGRLTVEGASQPEGYQGQKVTLREAQLILQRLGYDIGPAADGKMGAKTKAALEAFQRERGLPVTGRLDEATSAELAAQR